jgi:hypothetical protein
MKDTNKREHFLSMRAEGLSYQVIADKLQMSKQTLINWGKELQSDIKNFKAIRLDAMYEQYSLTKEARIRLIGEHIDKVRTELASRDLSTVNTDKLYDILLKLTEAQNKERESLTFSNMDSTAIWCQSSWNVD